MSDLASNSSLIALYRSLIFSILLAVISVLAYSVLPERKERIVPDQAGSRHLFFDAHTNGKSMAEWIDEKEFRFKCIVHTDGVA
jgi:hypothetical protein